MSEDIKLNDLKLIRNGLAQHSEEKEIKYLIFSNESSYNLLITENEKTRVPDNYNLLKRDEDYEKFNQTRWEHFKSSPQAPMTYKTSGLGVNLLGEKFVLYCPEYQHGLDMLKQENADCLARPHSMFTSNIARGEYDGPRFKNIL